MYAQKSSQLASALRAAGRDWPILPLYGVENGKCACPNPYCDHPGKHPLTAHGIKDATTDLGTIRRWWRKNPGANIGITTGRKSGLVVFDIDTTHGGLESLEKLKRENGPLPDCPRVRTGSGGQHLYFRHPGGRVKSRVGILPGIDIRADGAYVVGVGSGHKSLKPYRWLHNMTPDKVPLPTLPEAFLKLIESGSPLKPETELRIPVGQRNAVLASLAGSMRHRGMTQEGVEAALLQENRLRCDPPLSEAEVIGIARSISRYPVSQVELLSAFSKNDESEERILQFRTTDEIRDQDSTKVVWIAPPVAACGAIGELDGKVKLAGKTTFLMEMVRAVLDGRRFLGEATTKTKVIVLTEQPPASLRAALERADLLGRRDLFILFWQETIGMSWHSIARRAVQECKRRGAKLLIVDTLAQFAGLAGDSENTAGAALEALRPLQQAAAEGISVVIVRHERKSGGALGDSGRGSSAFAGAVDIVVSLRRPEGNYPRNVRLLQTVSRFNTPDDLLIELTDSGYRVLGTPGEAAQAQAAADLLENMPESKGQAATINTLVTSNRKSRAQVQKLLDTLLESGDVERSGTGRKGNPYRYFKR